MTAQAASKLAVEPSIFDLRDITFSDNTRIKLAGDWCFNWQEFLPSSKPCPDNSSTIPLPSKWNKLPYGKESFPRQGYATYSTTILLPENSPHLGIFVPIFYRAGEFFINGESVLKVGQPAISKLNETPRDASSVIPIPIGVKKLQVVVHVSSFHHIDGGINKALEVAQLATLKKEERIRSFSSILLVGSSITIAAFFLCMGIGPALKKDYVYLLGAGAILAYSIRVIGLEQVWLWIDPTASALWILRFEYFGLVLAFPAFLYYLRSLFPDIVNYTLCRFSLVVGVGSFVFIMLTPVEVFAWLRDPWVALTVGSMLYYIYCIVLAIYHKKPDAKLIGSIVLAVILTTSNDLFIWFNVFSGGNLINFTYLSLTLGNVVILTLRMVRATKRENSLSKEIKQLNIGLQQKVDERTKELALRMTELDQQRLVAEEANIDKSRFLAAASHDLRQPLHAMNLFLEALQHSDNEDERLALHQQLERTLGSLTEMFDALLDISRLDAAAVDIVKHPVAIGPLLEKLCQEFAPVALTKGIVLYARPCSATLFTDPLWLERILRNLLNNAVRYTGKGRILLACRKRSDRYLLQVWDTGKGIAPEQQEIIFDEFTQLQFKQNQRERNVGIGLGLAIVRRLSVLMGHTISLSSRPGRGSVFSLAIMASNEVAAEAVSSNTVGLRSANRLQSCKVLLIDDDKDICTAMATMLQKWGCTVWQADCGDGALALFKQESIQPDVIVSDYHLGSGINGLELVDEIKQGFGVNIPAMFVTGETSPKVIQNIENAGHRILHKPVHPAKMRIMLSSLQQANGT